MKIFCIGFQKTATTSLHQLFLNNNLKSTHDPWWWYREDVEYLNKYDCFTDGFERCKRDVTFPNLIFLEENFKNCKFILQTRSLKDWLISRLRHGINQQGIEPGVELYKNGINTNKFDEKVFLTWVCDRNYWFSLVYNHFKDKDNLLILDINSNNIEQKIYKFLNIKSDVKFGIHNQHKKYDNKKDSSFIKTIDDFLNDYINETDHNSTSIVRLKDR